MRVIDEVDAVQVDDAEIRCRGFQLVHVDDFLKVNRKLSKLWNQENSSSYINFFFFLLNLLVRPDEVKHLEAIDEVVNLSHEAFHEDDLGQANAEVAQFGWKGLQLAEVVKLHG